MKFSQIWLTFIGLEGESHEKRKPAGGLAMRRSPVGEKASDIAESAIREEIISRQGTVPGAAEIQLKHDNRRLLRCI